MNWFKALVFTRLKNIRFLFMWRNVFLIRREVLFDIFLIRNCLLTRRKGSREIFWAGKNPRQTQTTEARCCCSFVYLSFHLGERSTISAASLSWLFKTVKHGKGSHTIPITNVVAILGRYYTLTFTQIFKKKSWWTWSFLLWFLFFVVFWIILQALYLFD